MKSELLLHVAERWHTVALRPGGKRPLLPGAASTRLPPEARAELLLAGASFAGPLPPPNTRAFTSLLLQADVTQMLAVTEAATSLERLAANVGIETGPISNLAVLDVDPPPLTSAPPPSFRKALELAERLRAANFIRRAVTTPSGGVHYYVSLALGSEVAPDLLRSLRVPGADLQLRGAYVACPPSVLRGDDGSGTYTEVSYDPTSQALTQASLSYLRNELFASAPDDALRHGDLTTFRILDPPDSVPAGRRDEAAFAAAVQLAMWPEEQARRYITRVLYPRIEQPPGDPFPLATCLAKYERVRRPTRDEYIYEADLLTLKTLRPDVYEVLRDV